MKFRNGFVSNSSSSSFAICGSVLNCDEFKQMMAALGHKISDDDYDSVYNVLATITKGTNLEYYIDEECNIAIGRSFATIENSETGAQFKEDAKQQLKKALGKEVPCETHIDHWYT